MHSIRLLTRLRHRARLIKRDIYAVYLASRDSRVPWYVKVFAFVVVAYALSPIDLIPDFIPVLGYLDDVVILPLGLWLVIQLIPPALMLEFRAAAQEGRLPACRSAAAMIIGLWMLICGIIVWQIFRVLVFARTS
jgi:uncharacterized membrane protein YkvA (DUF1232 family)